MEVAGEGEKEKERDAKPSLCSAGSPKDTVKDVEKFKRELQLELKNEQPVTFAFLSPDAFGERRLTDHAVLRRQQVPHR